jgi:hypothetical protein
MKKLLLISAVATLLTAACGTKQEQTATTDINSDAISTHQNLPGDSARYGLACDGCTDSIVVFLPYAGGDPDTFDIINAFQEHRLMGRPHIGDHLAVILSNDSARKVVTTINMSTLTGQWSYMVTPTLRHQAEASRVIPDSILTRLLAPREYSLRLRDGGIALTYGNYQQKSNTMSPVDYPALKRYTRWHLYNGRIVLVPDSARSESPDTATIVLLRRDSLVLRFSDHEQAYYRNKQKTTKQ